MTKPRYEFDVICLKCHKTFPSNEFSNEDVEQGFKNDLMSIMTCPECRNTLTQKELEEGHNRARKVVDKINKALGIRGL